MRAKRETRNEQSRDATKRRMPHTRFSGALSIPDSVLKDAKARGMHLHWIAETVGNQPHPNAFNVQGRLLNGWKPVTVEQYPELAPPVLPGQQESSIIRRGGLILVEMPEQYYLEERAEIDAITMDGMRQINYADAGANLPGAHSVANDTKIERVVSREGPAFKE